MNRLTTTDLWTLLAVAALTGIAAMLAMAETGLTRMSRARAMHLREEQRRGAAQLLNLVEQPARFLNLVLLLLLVVQFTATALFTSVMDRLVGGGLGVAIAALSMTLITFIFAEVAPKNLMGTRPACSGCLSAPKYMAALESTINTTIRIRFIKSKFEVAPEVSRS